MPSICLRWYGYENTKFVNSERGHASLTFLKMNLLGKLRLWLVVETNHILLFCLGDMVFNGAGLSILSQISERFT